MFKIRYQHQFSFNVSLGIVRYSLIGPFFLPSRLNGKIFHKFLGKHLLEEVPVQLKQQILFKARRCSSTLLFNCPAVFGCCSSESLDGLGGVPPTVNRLKSYRFFVWGRLQKKCEGIVEPHCDSMYRNF